MNFRQLGTVGLLRRLGFEMDQTPKRFDGRCLFLFEKHANDSDIRTVGSPTADASQMVTSGARASVVHTPQAISSKATAISRKPLASEQLLARGHRVFVFFSRGAEAKIACQQSKSQSRNYNLPPIER